MEKPVSYARVGDGEEGGEAEALSPRPPPEVMRAARRRGGLYDKRSLRGVAVKAREMFAEADDALDA